MITKVVDNFTGALTRQTVGAMNSGFAKYDASFGYDPFSYPKNLSWLEQPSIIGATLNFPLSTSRVRVEGSVVTAYSYGLDQKLVKTEVNRPSFNNPSYDTGSVLASFSSNTTSYGASMQFYGSTSKIFIGTDSNIIKVNFDGSAGNPSVAAASSITGNVPRPSVQFLGKMYFANGNNLIEIDSTETITTYTKLSPGFPSGTFIRDLDLTPDGNYMIITVSSINESNPLTFDNVSGMTANIASSSSFKFLWNGTDNSYTAYTAFDGYSLTANQTYGRSNYTMGYDMSGAALYSDNEKLLTIPKFQSPSFGSTFSIGNMFGFMSPEYVSSTTQLTGGLMMYGRYDQDVNNGLFRPLRLFSQASVASGVQEVLQVPMCLPITNLLYGSHAVGYTGDMYGVAKVYFSTLERLGTNTLKGYLYKFSIVPTGTASVLTGTWESLNEIFPKKVKPTEFRMYTEPLVADNSFKVEFVNSISSVLASKTFTAGTPPISVGQDMVEWNPVLSPATSWGVRITNLGSKNWKGLKYEVDFVEGGKR